MDSMRSEGGLLASANRGGWDGYRLKEEVPTGHFGEDQELGPC